MPRPQRAAEQQQQVPDPMHPAMMHFMHALSPASTVLQYAMSQAHGMAHGALSGHGGGGGGGWPNRPRLPGRHMGHQRPQQAPRGEPYVFCVGL